MRFALHSRIWIAVFSLLGVSGLGSQGNAQGTTATSSEAVNPFNEFMSPTGGVNVFSGSVALNHPLFTLPGRNGMDLSLEMGYSGNVQLNVLARNDKVAADWVGMGWRFGFGYIRCDANRTVTAVDDRYYYVSPKGVSQEILANGTGFILEKEPFWKVERTMSADAIRVLGWTLTDIEGRKFIYGDMKEPAVLRNATRYSLAWTGTAHSGIDFVGEGFAGTPSLHPSQWDLASEVDVSGNTIAFTYEQKTEVLKKGSWTSVLAYTKASYPKAIVVPGGGRVDFFRAAKPVGEVFDPADFKSEPDAFVDPLEEDFLDRVEIKNVAGLKIREFRMGYDVRSFVEKAGYQKRFLKEIREYGASVFVGSHRFKYAVEPSEKPDYPLGTLIEMETPLCGKVQFEFARMDLTESSANRIAPVKSGGTFNKDFVPNGGTLPGGGEFVVINNGGEGAAPSAHEFYVYNNEDGLWKAKKVKSAAGADLADNLGLTLGSRMHVICGDGFFLVTKYTASTCLVSLFEWDGKDWRVTNIYNKATASDYALVGNASGRMAALYTLNPPPTGVASDITFSPGNLSAYSYHKEGGVWKETKIYDLQGNSFSQSRLVGNHFMFHVMDNDWLTPGDDCRVKAFTWNGKVWTTTYGNDGLDRDDDWVLGNGFLAAAREVDQSHHRVWAYSWNGYQWERTLKDFLDDFFTSATVEGSGNGFFATRHTGERRLTMHQWTGELWKEAFRRNLVSEGLPFADVEWQGRSYDDYLLALYPRFEWHYITIRFFVVRNWRIRMKTYEIPYMQTYDHNAKIRAFHQDGNVWASTDFNAFHYPNTEKDPKLGRDFFMHNTNPSNGQLWNGTGWVQQDFARSLNKSSLYPLGDNLVGEKSGSSLWFYRKAQNSLASALTAFVVAKKTVYDPVRGQTSVYRYTYDQKGALYDMRAGTAKFHKATLELPDHGRKQILYHNGYVDPADGLTVAEANASYELSGNVFAEEDFNVSGKSVSRKRYTSSVFRQAGWPGGARSIRLDLSESTIDKVKTSTVRTYNPTNGLVEKTEEAGSGRKRITKLLWANQITAYSAMGTGGKYMLGQVAERRIYEGSETDANLKQCQVTTWAPWTSSGSSWHPSQTWTWNAGKAAPPAFRAFNHTTLSLNTPPWKAASMVDARDAYGRVQQESNPLGVADCALYGHGGNFAFARVDNARCSEVAILSGDFDDNQSGMLDVTNSWKKNAAVLFTATTHFGSASLRVPAGALGPEKSIGGPASGRAYVFSAWVYPISVSAANPIVLKVLNPAGTEILPVEAAFGSLQPGSTGGWQFIKRTIPAASMGTGAVKVQVTTRGTSEFYVDDIRFHPDGAQVVDRFLDNRFFRPVAEVSPAGSGLYSEFDGNARLLRTYSEDELGRKIKRSEMDYHLDGCAFLSEASGTLIMLKTSVGHIPFQKTVRDYGDMWVEPVREKALIQFAPENPYEEITVRINGGAWTAPCCRGQEAVEIDLTGATTVFEVRAGTGAPYRVAIRKPTDCWTLQGSQVSGGRGDKPALGVNGTENWIAYRDDQDANRLYVKKWNASTQAWVQMGGALSVGAASDPIVRFAAGTAYVAFLDRITFGTGEAAQEESRAVVKRWSGSAWVPVQGDGTVSKGLTRGLSFEVSGSTLWLAFSGDRIAEEGGAVVERPVYVRKWNGTQWVPVGDFVPVPDLPSPDVDYRGDGIEDGRVSVGSGESPSLAIHPDGTPHIAYVGHVKIRMEAGEASKDSPPAMITKKLIVTGGTSFWGDLTTSLDENGEDLGLTPLGEVLILPGADRVQLSFGGTTLYAAFAYTYLAPNPERPGFLEESEGRVLDVRRFQSATTFSDDSHWFPMASGSTVEEYAVAPLDANGEFAFTAQGGQLALAFVNAVNQDRMTVLRHDGTIWRSVGNPAFLPVDAVERQGSLALALGTGSTLAAFRQGGESGEARAQTVTVAAFSGSCPDLTLAQLEVRDNGQVLPMDWKFRSYVLYLEGGIRENATTADIRITPMVAGDLSKVWIIPSTGPAQVWPQSVGQPLPNSFTVGLAAGKNTVEVELVSADGHHRNRYRVVLHRLPPVQVTGTVVLETPSVPAFDVTKPGVYKVVVPADKTTFTVTPDITGAGTVFVNGIPVFGRTPIEVSLVPGTNVITIVIIDGNHNRIQFDIQVDRGTPSALLIPLLESVSPKMGGGYTALFGYVNPNAGSVDIPAGNLNGMRYQGRQAEYMGQTLRFSPGTVHAAFSVDFDGSPLTWVLQGQSVTASANQDAPRVLVEMKDNGLADPNVSKPQLRLTNISPSTITGLKVSLWVSRQEVPFQDLAVDPYYLQPPTIAIAFNAHPANENLMRIDLTFPATYSLAPGAGTGEDGPQLGIHFQGHWPGEWNRANDWSWYRITSSYSTAANVAVYDGSGRLLAGREPGPEGAIQPLPLSQANVFPLDANWSWRATPTAVTTNLKRKTQGTAGLQVEGSGHITVANLPMKTTDVNGENNRLLVDYYLPNGQPNASYKGQVQLFAHCPTSGLNDLYVGRADLTPLVNGQFSTLSFTLPSSVRTALAGSFRDFQFKWVLDINQASEQPVLDNMRFAP